MTKLLVYKTQLSRGPKIIHLLINFISFLPNPSSPTYEPNFLSIVKKLQYLLSKSEIVLLLMAFIFILPHLSFSTYEPIFLSIVEKLH